MFATNLRRLRHAKELSQEELAHKARVNRTYVSKLETGATWAGLEVIAKLAKALDADPMEFLASPQRNKKAGRS